MRAGARWPSRLGDLAAKGATPWWALVSIACPRSWSIEDFEGLYRGMAELAHKVHLQIVGGDMSSIGGPAVLSIAVVGRTNARPLPRSEAQPGWAVGGDRRPRRLDPGPQAAPGSSL